MSEITKEIKKRRTFAIISHPDAGKTTLTEKFLLYGGAINQAGSVKGKATAKHAVSDWMDIEKERGISVTSSVLQFRYGGYCINILDTPGHQDFSEDTYRTLMAADSAVMVIDASKGVEAQTRKLFKVCVMRHIPIFTFINKMDREARDTFDLLDDIEKELGIATCPVNWPIGSGKGFKGVYDRQKKEVELFSDTHKGTAMGEVKKIDVNNPELDWILGTEAKVTLGEDIELLDGAAAEFEQELVNKGKLSPVFFGSALTNFGVETFLKHFLAMTSSPLPRMSDLGEIDPMTEPDFSAFVFKIQANMNKAHRDRIAFMRICSGEFDAGMPVYHMQGRKEVRLSRPQQMLASERKIVDKAYGGDIIGVFDPGIFSIGDTLTASKDRFTYEGIPTFAPEHFARVRQVDTMKRKQFVKGINQIAQEGAIQIFRELNTGMEEIIVGVVGVLQFDVLKYRLLNEYNVEIRLENLPYEHIRWIENEGINMDKLVGTSDMRKIKDLKGRPLLLFVHEWSIRMTLDRNKELKLSEFGRS
ncbi:peptide chain release factor 3 [Muricomes intestini]|uniref:Peptide chain release factor 3 n=1 Tax=Muricomes intestini TaxID=1796634 RepID=A0A4R3K8M6_9FIRM|nr:peptide chain release factor 3 [Muricomes intestini]TCS79153.1 peptide chain release factor 3 [Muricomes intestini]HCR84911.1 peptide chain release factor 3 [Lachnospiraceae bacterium]